MKLTVNERITLLGILPKEGNFLTLKIIRKLKEDLSFTEAEHKLYQFKNSGESFVDVDGSVSVVPANSIRWNGDVDQNREFDFGVKATEAVVEALKELDKAKKLQEAHISLYEKFVEGEKE